MTCETGQMSVRPSMQHQHFKTLRLRDRSADADETLPVYSVGHGQNVEVEF